MRRVIALDQTIALLIVLLHLGGAMAQILLRTGHLNLQTAERVPAYSERKHSAAAAASQPRALFLCAFRDKVVPEARHAVEEITGHSLDEYVLVYQCMQKSPFLKWLLSAICPRMHSCCTPPRVPRSAWLRCRTLHLLVRFSST